MRRFVSTLASATTRDLTGSRTFKKATDGIGVEHGGLLEEVNEVSEVTPVALFVTTANLWRPVGCRMPARWSLRPRDVRQVSMLRKPSRHVNLGAPDTEKRLIYKAEIVLIKTLTALWRFYYKGQLIAGTGPYGLKLFNRQRIKQSGSSLTRQQQHIVGKRVRSSHNGHIELATVTENLH
jgi:hypothetical protein